MPVKTKRDEEKWQKAKEIAAEQGNAENYALIMGIYKKMKPDYEFKSGPASKKAAQVSPDVQKMITAVGRMLKAAQNAFPGSKFSKAPVPKLRYPPGSLPPELEGRFVTLHVDLFLPQMTGNKARLQFGLDDAYRFFNVQEMTYPRKPILPDGRYRLLVNPTGFNDRAEWDEMAKMLRPFKVAPKSNVDRTTQQITAIADKITKLFEAKAKAAESEGPFDRMNDTQLDSVITEWADFAPEDFWQDGELDMSHAQAMKYYRNQWRRLSPREQKAKIQEVEGYSRMRWATRVAARYLRRIR